MTLEEGTKERTVAAADVDDRLVATPLHSLEPLEPPLPPLRHRAIEGGPLLRVRREPRPELLAEHAREWRFAAHVQPANRCEPRAAEKAREVVPAVDREELRGRRVAEDARLLLGEDPVARERTQEPLQRVSVRARLRRELGDRPRPVREPAGDVELGDERERAGDERATERVPECGLRRTLAHARAARTAAAASSASASVSVRQSSRSRPSRTTPTTGGSPARSGSASDSSSAHAKLGSSASGNAPPPTRPTVSSTSPPVAAASRSARSRTTDVS